MKKAAINFLKTTLIKAAIMAGFTYFSVSLSLQTLTVVMPSLLAGGLYFFTEYMRFYNLSITQKRGFVHII